ncbi:bacteriocin [Apilactobacillus micheneri]|uniref:bacteriocin n=1 Tax=Apilactobacillus micheneri TaxID=1899430 RepID=UPI00112AE82E|nr:bacteriocin [Apilactobacillus micheneri]TPR42357.1 bacteriocin [Apilactobacillus micheneri]TPR47078.1 bacteriocin [Apilactobacillus micheneri]
MKYINNEELRNINGGFTGKQWKCAAGLGFSAAIGFGNIGAGIASGATAYASLCA